MSPSLRLFRRLRAFPSSEVGPFDSRPLALLAPPRAVLVQAVLGQMVVFNTASTGSASEWTLRPSSRCYRMVLCRRALSRSLFVCRHRRRNRLF